jgi:hypothetical protein
VLIERSSVTRPNLIVGRAPRNLRLDMASERRQIERPREPEGPRERTTTLGHVETNRIGVHVGSPSRQLAAVIDDHCAGNRHDPQQV